MVMILITVRAIVVMIVWSLEGRRGHDPYYSEGHRGQ